MMETFSAPIHKTGINPYVDVPLRVSRAFGRRGYVPVRGSINRFTFRATLVPVGDGRHRLYVNGTMRKGAAVDVGDRIRVALETDDAPREMPVPIDLARGLRQAGAWGAFQRARPSDRKDILAYHTFLKTPEARKRNVQRVLDHLRRWGLLGLPAVVALLTLLGQFPQVHAMAQEPPTSEAQFRAYWVDSFGPALYTEAQIDQLVADTLAANLNAIVAQVTRRADCLCNRSVMTRTEAEIDPEPFDPLQTLIDKAHAAGLEVHAWLNTGIMWASDIPPLDPSHVFYAHGPSAVESENWVMRRYDGAIRGGNLYFFDPGHPAAADYIVNMFLSIVRNYDVDGINFDFIRYPDFNPAENVPGWGYNPVALARFQALTGRSDIPAPTDPEWMAWRREQISSILRRVYVETYAIKPLVRVSADTITYGNISDDSSAWTQWRPYREVLQDWRGWMEEGILDLNIPMNYRREVLPPPGQAPQFEPWNRFIRDHQYNRQAAVGTALYLNSVDENVAQIRRALTLNPNGRTAYGWVGFSYRTPDVLVNQRRRLPEEGRAELARALTEFRGFDVLREYDLDLIRAPVFPSSVPVPPMPWKLAPTKGHVHGAIVRGDGSAADQVQVDLYDAAGTLVTSRRATGTGWFGFVDLAPGEYTLTVTGPAGGTGPTPITVTAGRVTPVSLVLGR